MNETEFVNKVNELMKGESEEIHKCMETILEGDMLTVIVRLGLLSSIYDNVTEHFNSDELRLINMIKGSVEVESNLIKTSKEA